MNLFNFILLACLCAIPLATSKSASKEKANVDLEDYMDKGKTEELTTSETGYYPYHHHGHGYHHGHHHHHVPIYVASYGHHDHGYHPHHGYAQTHYIAKGYGHGYGHVGSAHVSFGTHIHHGHGHGHHHHHGYYG